MKVCPLRTLLSLQKLAHLVQEQEVTVELEVTLRLQGQELEVTVGLQSLEVTSGLQSLKLEVT